MFHRAFWRSGSNVQAIQGGNSGIRSPGSGLSRFTMNIHTLFHTPWTGAGDPLRLLGKFPMPDAIPMRLDITLSGAMHRLSLAVLGQK